MNVVYKLTSPSGKVYIGMSTNFAKRMRAHVCERQIRLGRQLSRFHSAMSKYPLDMWQKELLTTCTTRAEAGLAERSFIQSYKSTDPNYGYNLASGGNGGDTGRNGDIVKRKAHSDFMKRCNEDPAFVKARIIKGLTTLRSDPEHYKADQHRKRVMFRDILGTGRTTGIILVCG